MRLLSTVTLIALLGAACTTDSTLIQPATFERPADVSFVCYSTTDGSLLPLTECEDLPEQVDDAETLDKTLLALVTQTARGEVATVNLMSELVIDADVRVPGYTFVRVGEVPTAVLVPPSNPARTYVASFGGRRLESFDTARFDPAIEPSRVRDTSADVAWLPDGPVDIALAPSGEALFAALPESGAIVRVDLDAEGRLIQPSDPEQTLLDPGTPTLGVVPPAGRAYDRVCPLDADVGPAPSTAPRSPVTLGDEARPVALLVVDDELLVADAQRPLIHRFAIAADGSLSALDPIHVGVPTRALAVTPEVPETFAGDVASEPARYLYAIDATDASVLVVDLLPGSSTFGAVLPVSVGQVSDRVALRAGAYSLEVVTPDYPGDLCELGDGEERLPTTLRGVFVAVGQVDGRLTMIDVLDLDARCRGGEGCNEPERAEDVRVFIRRHQPRVGDLVTEPISLTGTLLFSFDGSGGRLGEDGSPSGTGPGLSAIMVDGVAACPGAMDPVFPSNETTTPFVCATVDPFVTRVQRWRATYQGEVPSAFGAAGRLAGSVVEVEGGELCARGVLGSGDVSGLDASEPEAGYDGDVLVVESDPLTGAAGCEAFVADEDGNRDEEIVVPIVRAFDDRFELDAGSGGFDSLSRCFPASAPFAWRIETRGAFTVVGSTDGFVHRVVRADDADTTSACIVDTMGQPVDPARPASFRNSRAQPGRLFRNQAVAFTIDDGGVLLPDSRAELSFQIGLMPTPLDIDTGAQTTASGGVVSELAYDPTRELLYAIDSAGDALVEYDLTPFQTNDIYD